MKRFSMRILIAIPILGLGGCILTDKGSGDPVFTCDASATVAELCIEEPASLSTQETSKATCLSAKGSWSNSKTCPTGYANKCGDGDKTNFYYAKSDGSKTCTELVSLLNDPFAGLFPDLKTSR